MVVLFRCLLCPPSVVSPSGARRRCVDLPAVAHDAKQQIQHVQVPTSYRRLFLKFDHAKILSFSPDLSQFDKSKGVGNASRRMSLISCVISRDCHLQTWTTPAALVKSLVAANALTFMLPLEALAETCESADSFFNMPVLFAIAMVGATVGGLLARQRRGELARLNEQLRQINAALRRQAKIESYAPTLSYAPTTKVAETEVVVDPRKEQVLARLRSGKNFLRNQDPDSAFHDFKAAFDLAQSIGDHVDEKKAARGLGASLQRQGKYREAIKYHSKVLEISKRAGEESGSTEAYGAIADCYTELGDLERAGKFYDRYIARLESD